MKSNTEKGYLGIQGSDAESPDQAVGEWNVWDEKKQTFGDINAQLELVVDVDCGEGWHPDTTKCDPKKSPYYVCVRDTGDTGTYCASCPDQDGRRNYSTYNRIKSELYRPNGINTTNEGLGLRFNRRSNEGLGLRFNRMSTTKTVRVDL